jgi:hypothetical protein
MKEQSFRMVLNLQFFTAALEQNNGANMKAFP